MALGPQLRSNRRQEGTRPKARLSGKDVEPKDARISSLECSNNSACTFVVKQPDDEGSPGGLCPSADEIRELISERNKEGNGAT